MRKSPTMIATLAFLVVAAGCAANPDPSAAAGDADPGVVVGEPGSTSDATIDNLRAFARLYGYVRYFHPSDAASAVDWERFAVHGVRQVKDAATAEELRTTLETLFGPIAPTVQLYPADAPVSAPPAILAPADTTGLELVAWQHQGVDLGTIPLFRSIRLDRETEVSALPAIATVSQEVDATPYRGMELRLEAAARLVGSGSRAELSLRVGGADGRTLFFDDVFVTAGEWQPYAVAGNVPVDAVSITVSSARFGRASAWFDDFRLLARAAEGEEWIPVPLANPAFDEGPIGQEPPGWSVQAPGHQVQVTEEDAHSGARSLLLALPATVRMAELLFEARPRPGESAEKPLGRRIVARIPLALYSRAGRTLRPDGSPPPDAMDAELERVALGELTAADEGLRYANVVIAWNVMQHFYPYFDVVDVDWDAVLTEAFQRALTDRSDEDFLRTLRWMMARLEDGHGRVEHRVARALSGLPFVVDLVEGEVGIVAVAPGAAEGACFRRGDVIASIDRAPSGQVLRESMRYISGSPQWRLVRALRAFGQGERGSTARLVLERAGGASTCEVTRDFDGAVREARPAPIEELRDGIFYVDLDRAPMNAIRERIEELAEADGIVFDMRGYPAGNHAVLQHLTADTIRSAEWKIPRHIYPDQRNRVGYATDRWVLPPLQPRFRGRAVFLTDGRAMSYAESVMGIVEHYRLGEIVGQPTGGVNGNQNPFYLPGGFQVFWTGMRVDKHDGTQLHNVGVLPTVPMERTLEGVRAGRDELLERALELAAGHRRSAAPVGHE